MKKASYLRLAKNCKAISLHSKENNKKVSKDTIQQPN